MKYKGWVIVSLLMMPRSYYIKDISENNNITYGKELIFSPKLQPKEYTPYGYAAEREGEWINHGTLKGLKKLIEKTNENPTNNN